MRQIWTLPPESTFWKTGPEWFLNLLTSAATEMRAKQLFLFWRVWHHRNNLVHGDGKASVSASVTFLQSYLSSYVAANSKPPDMKGKVLLYPSQHHGGKADEPSKWQPPPAGSLKANVDGGWDSSNKQAGLGIIIRDEKGSAIHSAWDYIPYCANAEEAEARACLEGLHHLIDLQRFQVIVEIDCQQVLQAVNSTIADRSLSQSIYREIKDLLHTNPLLELSKVDRCSNQVAHQLGQLGKCESSGVLSESTLSCVSELIAKDCKHFVL
jgi:ribonuclease HI